MQGGVSLILTNNWASRVKDYVTDDLGRLTWITLDGRNNQKLKIIAMYRSQPGYPHDGKVEAMCTQ